LPKPPKNTTPATLVVSTVALASIDIGGDGRQSRGAQSIHQAERPDHQVVHGRLAQQFAVLESVGRLRRRFA